jgi:hypothetical protein
MNILNKIKITVLSSSGALCPLIVIPTSLKV